MGSSDRPPLLALQEEAERLRMLIAQSPEDPQIAPMHRLLQEANHVLQEAVRMGAAIGLLVGPILWWEASQRRHESHTAAALAAGGKAPLPRAKRHTCEEIRILRQQALLAHLDLGDHPRLVQQAQALCHDLMRAQLLVTARRLMLRRVQR
jgi:hypothetical protein